MVEVALQKVGVSVITLVVEMIVVVVIEVVRVLEHGGGVKLGQVPPHWVARKHPPYICPQELM